MANRVGYEGRFLCYVLPRDAEPFVATPQAPTGRSRRYHAVGQRYDVHYPPHALCRVLVSAIGEPGCARAVRAPEGGLVALVPVHGRLQVPGVGVRHGGRSSARDSIRLRGLNAGIFRNKTKTQLVFPMLSRDISIDGRVSPLPPCGLLGGEGMLNLQRNGRSVRLYVPRLLGSTCANRLLHGEFA